MKGATVLAPASDPEVRRSGLGSSDAATIVGLNPWKGALQLWAEKRGLIESDAMGEAAYWGTRLEPVLLEEYARRTGRIVVGRNELGELWPWGWGGRQFCGYDIEPDGLLDTLRHPDHAWMMCHLDGLAYEIHGDEARLAAIIEAKTASAYRSGDWGADGSDAIPHEYMVQVQWAAEIVRATLGRPVPIDSPTLIGGQAFRLFSGIPHDPEIAAMLIREGAEFWRRVQDDDPPPADPDERGLDALARLFPQHDDAEEIVVTPGSGDELLLEELIAARQDKADAEARCEAAEVAVKERMKTAAALIGPRGKVTWKTQTRKNVDHKAVFADAGVTPDIIQRHTSEKPSRVFRVTVKDAA